MEKNKLTDTASFLKKIIQIPSPSGREEKVEEAVKDEMKKLGYDRIVSSGGNVCGVKGKGSLKILYDAHMDVVEAGRGWNSRPFEAVEKKGFLYGRGACDDKGTLAAMIYGGAAADMDDGISLYVLASVKEETGEGNGLKDFFEKENFKPDFVVIGEPSGLMVAKSNRGRIGLKIEVKGVSSHASRPEEGENAVYRAMEIVEKIKKFNLNCKKDTVSVTKISTSNENINIIPQLCSIYVDYRSSYGRKEKDVMRDIRKLTGTRDRIIKLGRHYKPWQISEKHLLLQAALECRKDILGPAPPGEWAFCTNGSFTAGELGIPTVGFGPGSESECHRANEKIKLKEVEKAAQFFSLLPSYIAKKIKGK